MDNIKDWTGMALRSTADGKSSGELPSMPQPTPVSRTARGKARTTSRLDRGPLSTSGFADDVTMTSRPRLASPDDAALAVDVEQAERVVSPVEEVGELVVRRQIAVARYCRPDLRPSNLYILCSQA